VSAANTEPLPGELLVPHPRRLSPNTPQYAEILAVHEDAVRRGEPGYDDPLSGLWVMTAAQLWGRGFCCYSGCRHCPWIER
jgi:Family of unknown function (DUF5522)